MTHTIPCASAGDLRSDAFATHSQSGSVVDCITVTNLTHSPIIIATHHGDTLGLRNEVRNVALITDNVNV